MKKNISIVVVLLLLVSGVYIYKYSNAQINPNDFIIKVDTKTFIKTSEDKVLNFYEKNKEDLKALATYLLANEKVLGAWPFILDKESNRLTEKITDESIAYFGHIRTVIPATSGQRFGIIRTAKRKHPDSVSAHPDTLSS